MKKLLDANIIKIIAIIAMSIDHITWMIYPGYPKETIPIEVATILPAEEILSQVEDFWKKKDL